MIATVGEIIAIGAIAVHHFNISKEKVAELAIEVFPTEALPKITLMNARLPHQGDPNLKGLDAFYLPETDEVVFESLTFIFSSRTVWFAYSQRLNKLAVVP